MRSLGEEAGFSGELSPGSGPRGVILLASLLALGLAACQGASAEGESAGADPVFAIVNHSPGVIGLPALSGFAVRSTEGETRQAPGGEVELDPGGGVVYRSTGVAPVSAERELVFELYSLSQAGHRGTRRLRLQGALPWKVEVVGEGLRLAFYPSGVELEVLDVREVMPAGQLPPR